jgi:hypothetical protein
VPSEGDRCPHCGLLLVDLAGLPPSLETRQEAEEAGYLDPPEFERQAFWYLGRGRGALTAVAALGLCCFVSPWVHLERPDPVTLSGLELAKAGLPWLFGGGIGWFLLIPLVWSRRSVAQLQGVRVIAAALSALTTIEAALLFLRPPLESHYYSSGLRYGWGLYASLVISLVGLYLALTLGGSPRDLRDLKARKRPPSAPETLH